LGNYDDQRDAEGSVPYGGVLRVLIIKKKQTHQIPLLGGVPRSGGVVFWRGNKQ